MNAWGCAVQTSNFCAQPRTRTRLESCTKHGEYQHTLVEGFDGGSVELGCLRCRWEGIHTADVDTEAYTAALANKRQETLNAALFATGIAPRFRNCSLDNYRTPLEGQKAALAACKAYVDQFRENYDAGRCLLLLGNFGNGKTHLGCAILRAVVTRYGATALYAPAPDIIAAIKTSFGRGSDTTEQSIHAELTRVDLLLIDELGAQGGTEFERQSLHQVIDTRYRNLLPTIITSNLPGNALSTYIGDRALDRLRENGGEAIAFDWASARSGEQ